MAGRKTYITFGLVNIPVDMHPIIKNNDTSFNQLHKKCLTRVNYVKYCPQCKKNLKEDEIVKGYQYAKDDYLVFDKEEMVKLKLPNYQEIDVIAFIDSTEISPIYYEKSYLLNPDTKSKSYMLFCEALKKTKKVALAKTVISTKFYYCILRLMDEGIIMTTLYFQEEIDMSSKVDIVPVEDRELNLAVKLIESMKGKFEPEKYKDEYQDNIKKVIDSKLKGKKISAPKSKNRAQIDNLLEALEKSLKGDKK